MGSVVDRPPDGGDHVLGHLQRVFGIENPRGGARRLAARIDEIVHLVRGGDPRRLFDDDVLVDVLDGADIGLDVFGAAQKGSMAIGSRRTTPTAPAALMASGRTSAIPRPGRSVSM